MTTPRVFVGTMCCGEPQLQECLTSINDQQGVEIQHVVINDLPEREAHNRLWSAWRAVQNSGFDMFVKVDADTVLAHDAVFIEFWKMLNSNSRVTSIQAPLLDYFTNGYINGLNCFSPKVIFRDTSDHLYCDRVDTNHDIQLRAAGVVERLRPAGFHCFNPSMSQAFHFGLHRALKNQTVTINLVRQAWLKERDRARGYALIGAQMAPMFATGEFNYTDERYKTTLAGIDKRYDELVRSL